MKGLEEGIDMNSLGLLCFYCFQTPSVQYPAQRRRKMSHSCLLVLTSLWTWSVRERLCFHLCCLLVYIVLCTDTANVSCMHLKPRWITVYHGLGLGLEYTGNEEYNTEPLTQTQESINRSEDEDEEWELEALRDQKELWRDEMTEMSHQAPLVTGGTRHVFMQHEHMTCCCGLFNIWCWQQEVIGSVFVVVIVVLL